MLWWALSSVTSLQPAPIIPDADFRPLIDQFRLFPKELWFQEREEEFASYLDCYEYRYIVYESNGDVLFDSKPRWPESPESLRHSFEYIRCMTTEQAAAIRGICHPTLNLCELVKKGDRYRIVHVSEIRKYY